MCRVCAAKASIPTSVVIVAFGLSHGAEQVVGQPVLDGPDPQLAAGSGRLWSLEIETSGYCGQRA